MTSQAQRGYWRAAIGFAPVALQVALFGLPLAVIAIRVFTSNAGLLPLGEVSLENVRNLFVQPRYRAGLANSLCFGLVTAALCAIMALPAAFALRFWARRRMAALVAILLLSPLVSSQLMRAFAWQALLSDSGPIAIASGGSIAILNTQFAVLIGLLSHILPICTVIQYITLLTISDREILAARNLCHNKSPLTRLFARRAWDAFQLAFFTAFVLSFLDELNCRVLGGSLRPTLGVLLADRLVIQDWGVASAIVCIAVAISISCLLLSVRIVAGWSALREGAWR